MLAPLTKLLPWTGHPALDEQLPLVELVHDLDRAQELLDDAAQNVDHARRRYDHELQIMGEAAAARAKAAAALSATPTGASIWSRWRQFHRWGRHRDDAVFRLTT